MVQEEEGLANRQTKFLQFLAQALGVDVKVTDNQDPQVKQIGSCLAGPSIQLPPTVALITL